MDYQNKKFPNKLWLIGLSLLIPGIALIILSFMYQTERAYYNYLIMFMFIASVALGSLAIVGLEYLAGAVWSTPFRRVAEFLAAPIPILIILVIPIILGAKILYPWLHMDTIATNEILKGKSPYLNFNFFVIRTAVFFVIWIFFYFFILRNSKLQDKTKDVKYTKRNIVLSTILAPLFFITITFFAIHYMMSLEPYWYSTIYGVYYFAGTIVAGLAAFSFSSVKVLENNYLDSRISGRHLHSLGVLLFAFNIFWAYIAFSQYLLIWYADLPEETFWFMNRMTGSWKYLSLATVFIHFVIPFLVLISSKAKTDLKTLKIMGIWLLCAHYIDLYWLVMPTFSKSGVVFSWVEIGFPIAAVGLFILLFKFKSDRTNIMPVGDPKLESGIELSLFPDLSID